MKISKLIINYVNKKVSSEAYTPNADGEFCLNVGEKVSSLVDSRFIYDQPLTVASYSDQNIQKGIFIRYGEIYSDAIGDCEVVPRNFESSPIISVINSAFQRGEDIAKIANICTNEWMTNAPQFTLVSPCSEFVLWVNLDGLLTGPLITSINAKYTITYTDGTSSTHFTGMQYVAGSLLQIKAVPCGSSLIDIFATPGKEVDFYRVQIVDTDPIPDTEYASQYFKRVSCCRTDVEFYFLNEYGGRDAILFTQVDSIELEQSNAVFESFLDCEDPNALNAGKSIVDQTANDVFEVTSKFVNDYQTRRWIREFLTSPQKAVKTTIQNESVILSNVIVLTGTVKYYQKDESIYIRLQYILNENINLQKN